jgi:hypothetical protein
MTKEEAVAAENETEETAEGEALAEGATPQEVGEEEAAKETPPEEETSEEDESEEEEDDDVAEADEAIRKTVREELKASQEEKSEEAKGLDNNEVIDFVAAASNLSLPEIPPLLTPDQKSNLTDIEVQQYETNRRLALMEGERIRDTVMARSVGLTSILGNIAKDYADRGIEVTPGELFNHMKEQNIHNPEGAAKSLTFEAQIAKAREEGAREALKKVGKPVRAAKTLKGSGQPVSTKTSYKGESDALSGGISILESMRSK